MKTKLILAAALFFSTLISCNKNNKEAKTASVTTDDMMMSTVTKNAPLEERSKDGEKIPVDEQKGLVTDSVAKQSPLKASPIIDWDKKIIKTATLKLEVKNFKTYNEAVHKTVKQFGGYIAQEENNLAEDRSETVISIKVPVDQFEDMMNQLPGGDVKVIERKISTEDVTVEMVDTRSRLETKKQIRLKYLEFLKQSKNMEEVLQVQGEVNTIQEEIEAAAGRVEYLSHQSSFSTINLTFYEPLAGYKAPSTIEPSFLTKVANAFKMGATWIADLFVALISIWPILVTVIAGIFFIKRLRSPKISQTNS